MRFTNYHTGTGLVVDYMAGWNIGRFKLGLVGGYSDQFEDDSSNGVDVGNRLEELKVGPSLAYNWGPFIFNLNYQHDVLVENSAKLNAVWFNIALPLWVPR